MLSVWWPRVLILNSNLVCVCMQGDRVERERRCKIGKIEVIRYETTFSHCEIRDARRIDFTQANKKDVTEVTRNEHCMSTTRQGKLIRREKPYSRRKKYNVWNRGDKQDKLQIEYHMTQTLLDWGIQPIQPKWSRPGSSVTPSTSASVKIEWWYMYFLPQAEFLLSFMLILPTRVQLRGSTTTKHLKWQLIIIINQCWIILTSNMRRYYYDIDLQNSSASFLNT